MEHQFNANIKLKDSRPVYVDKEKFDKLSEVRWEEGIEQ